MSAPVGRPVILQILCEHAFPAAIAEALSLSSAIAKGGGTSLIASPHPLLLARATRFGARPFEVPEVSGGFAARRRLTARLADILTQESVDLIHVRGGALLSSLVGWLEGVDKPIIISLHDGDTPKAVGWRRVEKLLRRADVVISGSTQTAMLYREAKPRPLTVEPTLPFVDHALYDPDDIPAERVIALAKSWNLPETRGVLLVPNLIRDEKSPSLTVVGGLALGDYWLVSPYDPANGGDDVDPPFPALQHLPCRDLAAAYKLADAVLILSPDSEAGLAALLTARAMGKPVIAVDRGPARSILEAAPLQWVIPDNDAPSLQQAVNAVLAVPLAERAQATAAIRGSVKHLTGEDVACQRLLSIYRDVLARRRTMAVETVAKPL